MTEAGGTPVRRKAEAPAAEAPDLLVRAREALLDDPGRALELVEREEARGGGGPAADLVAGRAAHLLGRLAEARERLGRAALATLTGPAGLECALARARLAMDESRLDEAMERAREARRLASAIRDPHGRIDALNLLAGAQAAAGREAEALRALEEALDEARALGARDREANLLINAGGLRGDLGDLAGALEDLRAAHAIVRAVAPGSRTEATNLIGLGRAFLENGEERKATELFVRARDLGEALEDPTVRAAAANNVGGAALASGDLDLAEAEYRTALALAREVGLPSFEADNLDGLGRVLRARGDHEGALELHREALATARARDDAEGVQDALLGIGRGLVALGRPAEAREGLLEALALAEASGRLRYERRLHDLLAEAAEDAGDAATALRHLKVARALERELSDREGEERRRRLSAQFDVERYRLRTELSERARAEAEARVRERTRELEEARREVVERLAIAAEYRDDATGEHTRRVGDLAGALARRLGWEPDEVELLASAARLHDLGKIAVPDALLRKEGALTQGEFARMREHPEIGARILSGGRSRLLAMAEEIAHAHHERWDGRGYPLGLAGGEIPPAARIVAVADVYDALLSERSYKRPWSEEEAVGEIARGAGRQFDPEVVAAFLEEVAARRREASGSGAPDARRTSGAAPGVVPSTAPDAAPDATGAAAARREAILLRRVAELERGYRREAAKARHLVDLAFSEPLTGLGNRRAFDDDLRTDLRRAEREGRRIDVAFVDLDGLKGVNDVGGHGRGDELLRAFAAALGTELPEARAYRIGGDEFALLAERGGRATLLEGIERAVARVRAQGFPDFGASAGVATGGDPTCPDELLLEADARMYAVKRVRAARRTEGGEQRRGS